MRASFLPEISLSTRNIGVLRYHHLQIVLMFGQLRASWSDLVRPRRSGHWKTTFPDTFEPERARAAQCEGLQLEHQSPPKWCVRPDNQLPSSTLEQLVHLSFMLHAYREWLHRQVSLMVSCL